MFRTFHTHRGAMLALFSLLLVMLALCVGASAQQVAAGTPISRLLPADTSVVVSADVNWWWQNLATVRAMPQVQGGISAAEQALGISFDKDLFPCVGQFGFGMIDMKGNMPHMLFMLEIRDQASFNKVFPSLSTKIEALSTLKWMTTTHEGVSLTYADPSNDGNTVAWGQYGGWLVIGIGGGTIRKSINAWKGTAPALADNADWTKAVAQLPARPVVFCGANGTQLADMLTSVMPMMGAAGKPSTEQLKGLISMGAMSDGDNGLRFEGIDVYGPAMRKTMQEVKQALLPVDDKALSQLPPGTFVALLASNPAKIKEYALQQIANFSPTAEDKKKIDDFLKQAKPVLDLLENCTGQFAVAGSWSIDHGFGAATVLDTASADKAAGMVPALAAFLKATLPQLPVELKDGVASLPEIPEAQKADLHLKFCWTSKDSWFHLASAPELLNGGGQTTLTLPAEAKGASDVFLADMGFALPFLTQLEQKLGKNAWIDALLAMNLDKVQIVGYTTIADDGSTAHGAFTLNHLSGKALVDDVTRLIQVGMAEGAAATHSEEFKSQQTQSMSNLRQLAMMVAIHAQDHGNILPPIKTADDIKNVLKADDKLLIQPSSKRPYLPNASLAGQPLAKYADKAADIILFYDPVAYGDGSRCAAFVDGHVEVLSAKAWEDAKAKSGILDEAKIVRGA